VRRFYLLYSSFMALTRSILKDLLFAIKWKITVLEVIIQILFQEEEFFTFYHGNGEYCPLLAELVRF